MGRVNGVIEAIGMRLGQQQRRQILALDREVDEMEAKIKALESENLRLQAQVNPLEREIDRLKQQLEKQSTSAVVHTLDPTEIEIMKFIGERRGGTAKDICEDLGMHSVATEHFLGNLMKAQYLDQSDVPMVGAWYALSDKGNAYLVKNKLVPVPGGQNEQPSNPKGHHCDHCGSTKLKRTGSRPDPTFHEVGIKQALYLCLSCRKESAFTNDES